jgi:hypothetical protein
VRETEELEGLRLALTALGAIAGGEPPELDQPRLMIISGTLRLQVTAALSSDRSVAGRRHVSSFGGAESDTVEDHGGRARLHHAVGRRSHSCAGDVDEGCVGRGAIVAVTHDRLGFDLAVRRPVVVGQVERGPSGLAQL